MTPVLAGVLAFLALALLFYALLGGADFGAGILELCVGRRWRLAQRNLISHALAPVWEANHVWLILAIVILFVGFPRLYTVALQVLHLPVLGVLMGIVARGCAFTFRNYDPHGPTLGRAYTAVFAGASTWTAFFIGVTVGALALGHTTLAPGNFLDVYVFPWCNFFCVAVGLFTCSLFALLAAVFLVGETPETALRAALIARVAWVERVALLCGAAVFVAGEQQGYSLLAAFGASSVAWKCLGMALALGIALRRLLARGAVHWARLCVAARVACVLGAWGAVQYPTALRLREGSLSLLDVAAPEVTLRSLLTALGVGVVLIFPALGYLLWVFKAAARRPN